MAQLRNTHSRLRYHRAKRRWRRRTEEPVRRFRRAVSSRGEGRGEGGRRARRLHGKCAVKFLARLRL
eukprot:4645589-Pyramimonas_sp.AAC.1